jgi:hypothetical protein
MATETRMKSLLHRFGWGLLLMFLVTYALAWVDLVNNSMLTGNRFKDFLKSITYYFGWVIPYWWPIILIGSLLMSFIITGVKFGISKLR